MPTTVRPLSELDAINQVLVAIGQAPVDSLDSTNPDVAIVETTLNQVTRDVLAEGWTFNTERMYKLTPGDDPDDPVHYQHIVYPCDDTACAIQLDFTNPYGTYDPVYFYFNGDGYLYDKNREPRSEGEIWTFPVYCDVTWLLPWVACPDPMKAYITARTASQVSSRIIGDPQQFQMLSQYEAYCRATVQQYECTQGDYNYFGQPVQGNFYRSYQPYHALYR